MLNILANQKHNLKIKRNPFIKFKIVLDKFNKTNKKFNKIIKIFNKIDTDNFKLKDFKKESVYNDIKIK